MTGTITSKVQNVQLVLFGPVNAALIWAGRPGATEGPSHDEVVDSQRLAATIEAQARLSTPALPLTGVFAGLPVPQRHTCNKRHEPADVLIIAAAALADAESREAISGFGRTRAGFFGRPPLLANGIPGLDAFDRVIAKLAPAPFDSFGRRMASTCEAASPRCGRQSGRRSTGGARSKACGRRPTAGT